jgi:hypothetical protein
MNIEERIRQLGEDLDAMPVQKSPILLAFEKNYEKIESALAKGNTIEGVCKLFEKREFAIAPSTLRQHLRKERSKRKAPGAEVEQETSAPKGAGKSTKKRKDDADASPKAGMKPRLGAEEAPARSVPPVQPPPSEARPQHGKIQKVF